MERSRILVVATAKGLNTGVLGLSLCIFFAGGSRPLGRVHQVLAEAAWVFQTPVAFPPPLSPGHLLQGLLVSLGPRPCPPTPKRKIPWGTDTKGRQPLSVQIGAGG